MLIDEDGLFKIKGKKETDHNTIIATFCFTNNLIQPKLRNSVWRLQAPESNWIEFNRGLFDLTNKIEKLLLQDKPIDDCYHTWLKMIEGVAWKEIGKTTLKTRETEQFSELVERMRKEKREIRASLKEGCIDRENMIKSFKELQEKLKQQILKERAEKISAKMTKLAQDKTRNSFWKERKKLQKEPIKDNLTVKDEEGIRQLSPPMIMETMATYYETLYKIKPTRWHQAHDNIKTDIQQYQTDLSYENEWYNMVPTEEQILGVIERKKNGKATTDLKNEMLKRGKYGFTHVITPLIKHIWKNEEIPSAWNLGYITSIWKGKGDKESLVNHRGITVSSSIGNILEEIIDRRIGSITGFSQGQAGGKKGASTVDHLFLLRSLMTIAIKNKQNLFLTFFDVSKAYDNADVSNMLHVMWKNGVRGKLWRILKNLSINLTAQVKTRYGLSRKIERENGGRQGSRLAGRLFAKQMDSLSENFIENDHLNVHVNDNFSMGCFEFVDDVMTCTLGKRNQNKVLLKVDEFAQISKLEWGESKCQVMQVGRKVKVPEEWELGPKRIKNTTSYKYLGDYITNDGKNKQTIEKRFNQVQGIIRQINTTASSSIMKAIESKVILQLYDSCVIPCFLNNAESWTLTTSDEAELDKLGIRVLKRLFGLPEKTPSLSVIHSLGALFITQKVDTMKFMYLHKILKRNDEHWTKKMLFHLKSLKMGWAENISQKLTDYGLEEDWTKIKNLSKGSWKNTVNIAVFNMNKKKLTQGCKEKKENTEKIKPKTKYILDKIDEYTGKPLAEVISSSRLQAKTLIIARSGMLECGKNFRATIPETCALCSKFDDENHRMNECPNWKHVNYINSSNKVDFQDVYSRDPQKLSSVVDRIQGVWELSLGKGFMKRRSLES